jgi:GntR family transcriptional regulator/MocR family aminotransferase
VDRSAGTPLHQQVYDGYREAILRGDLRPGQKIPSSRELASETQISRFPVLHAYAQLLAEGYFESQIGSGTFISATLPEQMMSSDRHTNGREAALSGRRTVSRRTMLYPHFEWDAHPRGWGAFGVHQPAFDQFPFSNLVLTRSAPQPESSCERDSQHQSTRLRALSRGDMRLPSHFASR